MCAPRILLLSPSREGTVNSLRMRWRLLALLTVSLTVGMGAGLLATQRSADAALDIKSCVYAHDNHSFGITSEIYPNGSWLQHLSRGSTIHWAECTGPYPVLLDADAGKLRVQNWVFHGYFITCADGDLVTNGDPNFAVDSVTWFPPCGIDYYQNVAFSAHRIPGNIWVEDHMNSGYEALWYP